MYDEVDITGNNKKVRSNKIADEEKDYEHCEYGYEWVRGYTDIFGRSHKGYCRRRWTTTEIGVNIDLPRFAKVNGKLKIQTDRAGEVANNYYDNSEAE